MDRDTARPVVLALLAVVAIGLAAATLDSAVTTDSSGGFGVGPPSSDPGAPNGSPPSFALGNSTANGTGSLVDLPCFPVLDTWWAIVLIFAGFLLGGYVVYRRLGGVGALAYAGPVGIPILLVHAILTACTQPAPAAMGLLTKPGNISLAPEGGSGVPGGGTGTTLTEPSFLLMAGLALALLAAIGLLVVSSSGDSPEEDDEFADSDATQDVQAVGRAAGEAADRIESSTDVDNEVFRAWREMTDHLDVPNPQSSTPAEFAAAAVDAGMAREDVEELTSLFEAVRYGGESPTEEREQRALEALRRIEREYAGGRP